MKPFIQSLLIWNVLLLLYAPSLHATDPNTRVSQYGHSAWRVRDGLLSVPTGIAQTLDGYLWVGTETGLLRFDGMRAVPWNPPGWERISDPHILSLLAASDGTLWISTPSGLANWSRGKLTVVPLQKQQGSITALAEDHHGRVWGTFASPAKGAKPLCQLSNQAPVCFGDEQGIKSVGYFTLTVAPDGSLVLGGNLSMTQWSLDRGRLAWYQFPESNGEGASVVDALHSDQDGSVFVGLDSTGTKLGLQRLKNGVLTPYRIGDFDGSSIATTALRRDQAGALWIGTRFDGLYKITGTRVDHYTIREGLSGNSIRSFMEDREGNFWVVTTAGVDLFFDQKVVTWSWQEGLPLGQITSILASRDGNVFIGVKNSLMTIRDGKVEDFGIARGLPDERVDTIQQTADGRLLVGGGKQLQTYDGRRFKPILPPGVRPTGDSTSIAVDEDGSIWANGEEASKYGFVHVKSGRVEFIPYPKIGFILAPGKPSGFWFSGWGEISSYSNGQWQSFPLPAEHTFVQDLVTAADGAVLGGTRAGVWGIRDGKVRRLGTANGLPCQSASGLGFSRKQVLIIRTSCGIIEITPEALRGWWANPAALVPFQLIDSSDGALLSRAVWGPQMSLAQDGRVWIADENSIQVFDPDNLPVNRVPPPVHVEEAFADGTRYNSISAIKLPPLIRNLEIHYTALSFTQPQKVRFRYMLENRDTSWQDAGSRRTAFYQDLKPGRYRFRVLAANNDGVWNEAGDSIEFSVKPAWFQTVWFRALWITCACLLVWVLYRLRVRSIARAIGARFNERLDERTRMALELHDTFLQTVQGSKMVADDALDPTSDQARMRHALEKLSVWLEQAVTEGRAALHALRVSTSERNHLAEFLDRTAKEYCERTSIAVAITVIGDAVDLHPIVRDEIARIAEEAIRNACLHSKGSQLSIELRYARDLSLNLKDNGIGIDPDVVDTGRSGHFGIQGMKERSARIRARITITSTLNHGTQITLVVPGDIVYRREEKTFLRTLKALNVWRNPSNHPNAKTGEENHADRE